MSSTHWIQIALAPRELKAYFIDSMVGGPSSDETNHISDAINEGLNLCFKLVRRPKKFTLVSTDRGIKQKDYIEADYSVCWLMDYFLRFQQDFCTTQDFEQHFFRFEESDFDSNEAFG